MIDPISRLPVRSDREAPAALPSKPQEFRTLLAALLQQPAGEEGDRLGALLNEQLRLTLLEALTRKPELPPPLPPLPPIFDPPPPEAPRQGRSLPPDEAQVIQESAERAGVDPDFLGALRRAENGGPGREFGVLSVPAPTYQDQARVAAESIQKNLERFRRQGGQPVDPLTGRYTEEFIRFFSSRYAPVGAANDPRGLNRFHAGNLTRLYLKSSDRV